MASSRRQHGPVILATSRDIEAGIAALTQLCPDMARAATAVGTVPLRRWSPGFDGLVRIIIGQQLSVASANAILARVCRAVDPLDAEGILAASDETLRAAGLSAAKLATLRTVSTSVRNGDIDFAALAGAPPEAVREALTAVRGIGPWTADIWLVLCRGDRDAFACGDLALQVAVQDLFGLEARPSAAEMLAIAERWRPWRGVAARLLWATYATRKHEAKRITRS